MPTHRPQLRRAFTLVELGVVVVVVGILGVTVIPAWNSLTGTRQAAAAEEVERRLVMARSIAVAEGRPVGVRIDPATDLVRSYTIPAAGGAPEFMANFDGELDAGVLIAAAYPGADITGVSGGNNATGDQTLWFGFDGTPELRTSGGVFTSSWSSDAVITLAGGNTVTVRRGTGMVSR